MFLSRVLLLVPLACACPPERVSWQTPDETLATWQARFCRDDVQGEYACLSAAFQRAMQGFPSYHAARGALLEEHPVVARLLARADLAEHLVETSFDLDGRRAWQTFRVSGDELVIGYERETWITLEFRDGTTLAGRQDRPLAALLGVQFGRQWLDIARPELPPRERLAELHSLHVDERWKIADIAGLAPASGGLP